MAALLQATGAQYRAEDDAINSMYQPCQLWYENAILALILLIEGFGSFVYVKNIVQEGRHI
jgi:hypothetical protein